MPYFPAHLKGLVSFCLQKQNKSKNIKKLMHILVMLQKDDMDSDVGGLVASDLCAKTTDPENKFPGKKT